MGDWRRFVNDQRVRLRSSPPGARAGRAARAGVGADPEVLAALKSWRAQQARAAGIPAYVIFHDTTLAAVAEARPHDLDALLALPGVGPVKAARYGEDLLRVLRAS